MRPKNLKFPFTWEERAPTVHEGVVFVPKFYEKHGLWEEKLFSNHDPISIEYCSGNGDWVIDRAKRFPKRQWVAVEKQFARARKIWSKMRNEKIKNLTIVCGEAKIFTQHYLSENSIEDIYINFPDPWPKLRHAKKRLIQSSFIAEIHRVMKAKAKATFVTDDSIYRDQMIKVMTSTSQWKNQFSAPYYIQNWEDYGNSWFENLLREKGHVIYYMQFLKL